MDDKHRRLSFFADAWRCELAVDEHKYLHAVALQWLRRETHQDEGQPGFGEALTRSMYAQDYLHTEYITHPTKPFLRRARLAVSTSLLQKQVDNRSPDHEIPFIASTTTVSTADIGP